MIHNQNDFKCILESPDGEVFIGRGNSYTDAFQNAINQLDLSNLPKRGKGLWEVDQ